MIIVGAKGFANEILDILSKSKLDENIAFYDDINLTSSLLHNTFPILKTHDEIITFFKNNNNKFTIGVGNPVLRKKLFDTFLHLKGDFVSTVSKYAIIGEYNVKIGVGCNIMHGAIISNNAILGKGCIIYFNSIITHDVVLGDFVEASPGATILGRSFIGDFSQIGANATVLPDLRIGKNVIIAAGSVVTKDIPDNCMVAGVPAIIKKKLKPISL